MQNGASGFVGRLQAGSNGSKLVAVRVAAEAASVAAASLSSVVVGNVLLRRPYESSKDLFCSTVVEPRLEAFEKAFGELPSLDTPHDRLEREALPRYERARILTDKIMDTVGIKLLLGIAGQFAMQEVGLRALKVNDVSFNENMLSVVGDKVVNLMGVYALNRVIPDQAVQWQDNVKSVLLKAGFTEESAQNNASYLVNWQLPNMFGFVASLGLLKHFTKN